MKNYRLTSPSVVRGSVAVSEIASDFQRECVSFFADLVQVLGVPKSVGQIYGLLYAASTPLSFSDIVEKLDISKGSASQGLQLLRSLGAVNIVGKKKCPIPLASDSDMAEVPRRDYFHPELSLRKLVSGVLQERIMPLAATGADRLVQLRELVERNGDRSDFYLDRVKQLETWRRRLRAVLPVLNKLLGPKNR